MQIKQLSANELNKLLQNGEIVLVDTRSQKKQEDDIEGALNCPLHLTISDARFGVAYDEWVENFRAFCDRNKQKIATATHVVIISWDNGISSLCIERALLKLSNPLSQEIKNKLFNLAGGFSAWKAQMPVSQLSILLNNPENQVLIVDVRSEDEQNEEGKYPAKNTITVPYDKDSMIWHHLLQKKIRSEQARFDNATHIVFACHNGERSEVCRKTARDLFGYPLEGRDVNLAGGYLAWKDYLRSLPIESNKKIVMEKISAQALQNKIDQKKAVLIIDVRPPAEQEAEGQYPEDNTITIPYDSNKPEEWLPKLITEIEKNPEKFIDTTIVYGCRSGNRSGKCQQIIADADISSYPENVQRILTFMKENSFNLENGNNGWQLLLKSQPVSTLSYGEQSHLAFAAPKSPREGSSSAEPSAQPSTRETASCGM
jgi:rhodanese-related sulfurtransferase